jgi:Polyphosphate kinase C-terminal domain 2
VTDSSVALAEAAHVLPARVSSGDVGPVALRQRFASFVEREIAHAAAGRPSGIIIKNNSIADPATIRLLYRASQAGVRVDTIVRGICCLRPHIAASAIESGCDRSSAASWSIPGFMPFRMAAILTCTSAARTDSGSADPSLFARQRAAGLPPRWCADDHVDCGRALRAGGADALVTRERPTAADDTEAG